MKKLTKIAILGGGGRTGKYIVNQLIRADFSLKLLLRHSNPLDVQNPLIEIIQGDALDPGSVHALIKDCDAIISSIGQRPGEPLVAEQSTKEVLQAMERYNIQRYILLAGLNIDTPFDRKGPATQEATQWMKTNFPLIQEDRQKAYDCLVASTVDWTLVRVPFIEFTETMGELKVDLHDCLGSKISAQSIANFMFRQLEGTAYLRASPFIAE